MLCCIPHTYDDTSRHLEGHNTVVNSVSTRTALAKNEASKLVVLRQFGLQSCSIRFMEELLGSRVVSRPHQAGVQVACWRASAICRAASILVHSARTRADEAHPPHQTTPMLRLLRMEVCCPLWAALVLGVVVCAARQRAVGNGHWRVAGPPERGQRCSYMRPYIVLLPAVAFLASLQGLLGLAVAPGSRWHPSAQPQLRPQLQRIEHTITAELHARAQVARLWPSLVNETALPCRSAVVHGLVTKRPLSGQSLTLQLRTSPERFIPRRIPIYSRCMVRHANALRMGTT